MVRSSNPRIIMKDIRGAIERTVNEVIDEINTIAIKKTPIGSSPQSPYASRRWSRTGQYKIGAVTEVIKNDATYIGLLDGVLGTPTSDQAPDGIINPKLNNNISTILKKKRKIK